MNDIKKIKFKQIDEEHVQIIATFGKPTVNAITGEDKEIVIGDIFSESENLKSYSGKNSIQICGFDHMKGLWSCGRFNHSQDCCLVWNDIENFLKLKSTETTGSEGKGK